MQIADYVSSRPIGSATVTIVSEGSINWAPRFSVPEAEWRAAMPDADERGVVRLGLNVAHIKLGDASILIDPGLDEPSSAWGQHFAGRFENTTRTPGIIPALASIGVSPEDITHVLITHAHSDHICGMVVEHGDELRVRYPNARHLIGKADWTDNPARRHPDSELSQRLGPIERLGLLDVVEGEREVVPGVTMIPAPGETPGASMVRVDSEGERFFYVGDLYHHPCEASHPEWVSPGRDQPAMLASRRRLVSEALPSGALIVFTHNSFPPWGRLTATEDSVRWEPA